MGHATPARQPAAAQIAHARKKLAAYLAEHQETKAGDG
jgi:hypothetical protein